VLASPELPNVWLASLRFEENLDFDRGARSAPLDYRINSDITVDDLHRAGEDDETHAVATMSASIDWSEEGPFTVEANIRGLFVWDNSTIDEDLARSWVEYNATHLFWPYLRSYVTTITALSSFPSLTIYTVSVPESPDFESEENVLSEHEGLARPNE
jgi:preprotein translocase subunit SecB